MTYTSNWNTRFFFSGTLVFWTIVCFFIHANSSIKLRHLTMKHLAPVLCPLRKGPSIELYYTTIYYNYYYVLYNYIWVRRCSEVCLDPFERWKGEFTNAEDTEWSAIEWSSRSNNAISWNATFMEIRCWRDCDNCTIGGNSNSIRTCQCLSQSLVQVKHGHYASVKSLYNFYELATAFEVERRFPCTQLLGVEKPKMIILTYINQLSIQTLIA